MLKWLEVTTRRFAVFAILVMAASLVVPATASHACAAPTDVSISSEAVLSGPADACADCPDCGPACAGGCCHAPHAGMAADVQTVRTVIAFERDATWSHVVRAPMPRPAGPDRPPRP